VDTGKCTTSFPARRIAILVQVLGAIVKQTLKFDGGLHTILEVLSALVFEQAPVLHALADSDSLKSSGGICTAA
jgi:hypothetical protein